jgi:hypothetical protein
MEISFKKLQKILYLILIILNIQCALPKNESHPKESINNLENSYLKLDTKNSILKSNQVVYYELPETTLIQNPEEYLTFSQIVKNQSRIERFKTILTSDQQKYSKYPPKDCKPSYNSALVFETVDQKNIILFSINCGLLYIYKDELYIDITEQLIDLENNFRLIRSGR